MAETTVAQAEGALTKHKKMSRKQFLHLAGIAAATTAGVGIGVGFSELLNYCSEHKIGALDRASLKLLLAESNPKIKRYEKALHQEIKDPKELKRLIESDLNKLKLDGAQVLIADFSVVNEDGQIIAEEATSKKPLQYFPLGSQVKPFIMMAAYQHNPNLITEAVADRILTWSGEKELLELVDKLPETFGTTQAEKIHNIMKSFGAPLANKVGTVPQMGNLEEIFGFYIDHYQTMPDIIKKYLDPTRDPNMNYGLSNVLYYEEPKYTPHYKLGLWNNKDGSLNNSYMISLGNLMIVGYAYGKNRHDVHKAMLDVGARAVAYSKTH